MARLWSSGAELNTTAANVEVTSSSGSPTIDSSTFRSGAYSFKTHGSAGGGVVYTYNFLSGDTQGVWYARAYINLIAMPPAIRTIFTFCDAATTDQAGIRLNTDGTLELWNIEDNAQVGSDSSALNTGQWYRLELKIDCTTLASTAIEAKVDGTSFASGTVDLANGVTGIHWGTIGGGAFDGIYWDDLAINDTTGSFQNSWPEEGEIIHLKPDGTGDYGHWANDYQNIDEVTPDDATTMITSTATALTFGITADNANSSSWTIDRAVLSSATSGVAGRVTKLTARIWLDAAGSAKVKGLIYADSGGNPGALLATSDEVTITNTAEAAVDLPFSGANIINVTAATTYWIGYQNEDPGTVNFVQSRADTANLQRRSNDTYSDGPNDPWSETGTANGRIDCFATYEVIEDVTLEATPAALASDDTINCVQVGARFNVASTTGDDPDIVLRIKASSGGTVEESSAIDCSTVTWNTNAIAAPRNYIFTLYDLPGASTTAWTKAELDTAQIGVRQSVADTHAAQVSTMWLLVDHKPTAAGGTAIKTIDGLAKASVKVVNGLAIASVKTINGLA